VVLGRIQKPAALKRYFEQDSQDSKYDFVMFIISNHFKDFYCTGYYAVSCFGDKEISQKKYFLV
jgi:hypothetical protein